MARINNIVAAIRKWCFKSPDIEDNLLWVQRGLGLYLLIHFVFLLPYSTIVFSNRGVNVPAFIDLPEPPPIVAFALVFCIVCLGAIMISKTCSSFYIWAASAGFGYLVAIALGATGSAYFRLQLVALVVVAIAKTLNEKTWGVRMLQILVWNVYFWAAIHKLYNGVWLHGNLVPIHLYIDWAGELNYSFNSFIESKFIYQLLEIGVVGTELLIPILMLLPINKLRVLVLSLALHGGLAVVMNLPEFMNMVILCLAFLTPKDRLDIKKIGSMLGIRKDYEYKIN